MENTISRKNINKLNAENYEVTDNDLVNDYTAFLNKISDLPNTPAPHKQSISNTGISNQKAIIYIKDFTDNSQFTPVFCDINLGVDLKHHRGVHMSRYIQSIFELSEKKFNTLDEYAEILASAIKEKQQSEDALVEVTGTYIHKKLTRQSKLHSLDPLYLISKVALRENEKRIQTGMQVYNITACPCTKAHTKYMIAPALKAKGLTTQQINEVLKIILPATHTQRGLATLILDKESSPISHKELYSIFEKSTHLAYDLLKRPDEHDLIIQAIKKPQFTEDVTREITDTAYHEFKNQLSPNAEIYVESILNDAIHIHDVRTVIQKTFAEIQNELTSI